MVCVCVCVCVCVYICSAYMQTLFCFVVYSLHYIVLSEVFLFRFVYSERIGILDRGLCLDAEMPKY